MPRSRTPAVAEAPAPPTSTPTDDRLHVKDLLTDPRQTRRHTPRNLGMIGDALQEVGAARSIVIDEDNTILAGHGTVEAAGERGLTAVRVVEADGHELIAVRRRNLTPEQKAKLAIYDNRASDLAEFDLSALVRVTDELNIDRTLFFNPNELRALEDRDLTRGLETIISAGGKDAAGSAPSVPEGYVAFSVVLPQGDHDALRATLARIKDQRQVATLADALAILVRHYDDTAP